MTPPRDVASYDVVGYGEASIDDVWLLPPDLGLGGKGRARARHRIGGGQVATALVAASRLGARAAYLGPLGSDGIGDEIADGLLEERVDVLCERQPGGSRIALVLVGDGGDRTIVEDGHSAGPPASLPSTRALHVDGTQVNAMALCDHARERGVLISIDLDTHAAPWSFPLVERADLCVLAEGLVEKIGHELIGRARARGALVVETLGARGVRWGDTIVPSLDVEVVDTTACGDTLRGALLVAWLEGRRDVDALRFATTAAALKCRDLGRRGCPTRVELDAALARRQG